MIKRYAFILPLFLSFTVLAQGPAQVFEFTSMEELPLSAEKYLAPGIHALDRDGRISIDGRTVKIGVAADVDPNAVALALAQAGIGQFRIRVVTDGQPSPDASGYPILVHSEDPAADAASFQAAKQAWIEAHPDHYELLNQGESEPR